MKLGERLQGHAPRTPPPLSKPSQGRDGYQPAQKGSPNHGFEGVRVFGQEGHQTQANFAPGDQVDAGLRAESVPAQGRTRAAEAVASSLSADLSL